MDFVVVTRSGQALNYEGRLVRFPTADLAAAYSQPGDSIQHFDPKRHRDRPETRSKPGRS